MRQDTRARTYINFVIRRLLRFHILILSGRHSSRGATGMGDTLGLSQGTLAPEFAARISSCKALWSTVFMDLKTRTYFLLPYLYIFRESICLGATFA